MGFQSQMSPNRYINEMYLFRDQNPEVVFLWVEGSDDKKLMKRLINSNVEVRFCNGKGKVCSLMSLVQRSRLRRVIAIIDKDYDEILNETKNDTNLFYTDGTDMETTILSVEKAVTKILSEYADDVKIEEYNRSHDYRLTDQIFSICSLVGRFRLINRKYEMDLTFDNTNITRYISRELDFDLSGYVEDILLSSNRSSDIERVMARVDHEPYTNYKFWDICRGHDIIKVFQYVFSAGRGCLGFGRYEFSEQELARFIRGSYEEAWFYNTNLYRNLKRWQNNFKNVQVVNIQRFP